MKKLTETENEILLDVLNKDCSDSELSEAAEELEKSLDSELSRPDDEIDFSLTDQLSMAVIEARGNTVPEINTEQKLKMFKNAQLKRRRKFRFTGITAMVSAICLLLLGNIYTVKSWNMNIMTFAVEFTRGGVIIDFEKRNDEIILPVSEDDPYGMIAKCNETGIDAETPFYIPEGFYLKECENETIDEYKYLTFNYTKDKAFISITYDLYISDEIVGIPSDKHNITEISINGHLAIVSKEDNQMIAIFKTGDFIVSIFTQNVDYQECDKILESIRKG